MLYTHFVGRILREFSLLLSAGYRKKEPNTHHDDRYHCLGHYAVCECCLCENYKFFKANLRQVGIVLFSGIDRPTSKTLNFTIPGRYRNTRMHNTLHNDVMYGDAPSTLSIIYRYVQKLLIRNSGNRFTVLMGCTAHTLFVIYIAGLL